jgi:hypothetical protein
MLLPDPEEQFTSPGNFAPLPFLNLPSTFFGCCVHCVFSLLFLFLFPDGPV